MIFAFEAVPLADASTMTATHNARHMPAMADRAYVVGVYRLHLMQKSPLSHLLTLS
ncbi:hypothetical protein [Selenomonas noxia]|uniref:hypothetical protein n=1 Tax=Selenomonas noxia TaxID=135083 RepID=UPI0028D3ECA9|nr:hypothetical protein [Selenomonas noxia]